jgi:hypothetical protein
MKPSTVSENLITGKCMGTTYRAQNVVFLSELQPSVIQQLDSVANKQLMNDEEIKFALQGMMMMMLIASLPSHRLIDIMVADCEILSSVPTSCTTLYVCLNTEYGSRRDAVVCGTRYRPEGRGSDSRLGYWNFSWT